MGDRGILRAGGLAVAVTILVAAGVCGQPRWSQRKPTLVPPLKPVVAAAYDSARRVVVLVGVSSTIPPGQTWEWNGVDWVARAVAPPVVGGYHALAYDAVRRRTVLLVATLTTFETWEWDGFTWAQRHPRTMPPRRLEFAMAFDARRGRVLMFGGGGGRLAFNDLWEWDGTDWARLTPISSPPARHGHAMAYDPIRRQIVMFGGRSGWPLGDTWVWQGATWVRKSVSPAPSVRYGHHMAFDATTGRVLLFGGANGVLFSTGTWEWDGTRWSLRTFATPPPPKSSGAMAAHTASQRVVLYGGYTSKWPTTVLDTWEYGATHLTGSGSPRPGQTVSLTLAAAADAGHLYQLASSFDDGPIGFGNFVLGLQMDSLFWVSAGNHLPTVFRGYRGALDATGAAAASISIPGLAALVGQTLHTAFVVVGPPPNLPFRSVSNTLSFAIKP